MRAPLVLLSLSLLLPAVPGRADVLPPHGKFVYSDFCVGPQPWDVSGHRVVLDYGSGSRSVTITFPDQGVKAGPLHATAVIMNPAKGTLFFSYQTPNDEYTFDGIATPEYLSGVFDDDMASHTLPRVPDNAPAAPACKAAQPAP